MIDIHKLLMNSFLWAFKIFSNKIFKAMMCCDARLNVFTYVPRIHQMIEKKSNSLKIPICHKEKNRSCQPPCTPDDKTLRIF